MGNQEPSFPVVDPHIYNSAFEKQKLLSAMENFFLDRTHLDHCTRCCGATLTEGSVIIPGK